TRPNKDGPGKALPPQRWRCIRGARRIKLDQVEVQGIGVADMAAQRDVMDAAGPYYRARALSAFKFGDITFYWITRACAISVLLILGGIIISLIVGAWPAMKEYGLSFLFSSLCAPSAAPPALRALRP